MRTWLYALILLLGVQIALPRIVPDQWIYQYRVPYEIAKPDMAGALHLAMERVARQIEANPTEPYIIMLGDSVTYSGPGEENESVSYYLNQYLADTGKPARVYNFAEPGMHGADIYTVMLMLKEHGIPLKHVLVNQTYFQFTTPKNAKAIAWLSDELKRLDPEAWQVAGGRFVPEPPAVEHWREPLMDQVALWRYRTVLRHQVRHVAPSLAPAEARDTRPWREKQLWLRSLMQEPVYCRFYDPTPITVDDENAHVWLMERLIRTAGDAELLFWFTPVNQELLKDEVNRLGYVANLAQIREWFSKQPVQYLHLERSMPESLFTDHVHLTPQGYERLAHTLGEALLPSL